MNSKYKVTEDLCAFISSSPTQFHAVKNMENGLLENGFTRLDEKERWKLDEGKAYFVKRNSSALIAFRIPQKGYKGYSLVSAHTDSPAFKIKTDPEIISSGRYTTLNTEVYGGLLMAPWFDRPLSIAGRVFIKTGNGIEERLLDFARDAVLIPNLAIHMNRNVNDENSYKAQKPRTPHSFWGLDNEFFSSPRIDDLMCAYTAYRAIIETEGNNYAPLVCLFDNEETGSGTKQGALSDFLPVTIERISYALGFDTEEKAMKTASSFMISADNCHAMHPNYMEKCDVTNKAVMNGGIAIKFSAAQKYTTDAQSASYLRALMERERIPYQYFVNHSDIPGGSTLGNLSAEKLSVPSVDIGAAQLAMHSPYESAGSRDTEALLNLFKAFISR